MKTACILFPHQLFKQLPFTPQESDVFLIEEYLFFRHYVFHKQKLTFHRASMKFYESFLKNKDYHVEYIESIDIRSDIRKFIPYLQERDYRSVHYIDVVDDWLNKRLTNAAKDAEIKLFRHETPMFLNTKSDIEEYFSDRKILRQTDFYIRQRKKWQVLINEQTKPYGGQWTYDVQNRLKYPKDKQSPKINWPEENDYHKEAKQYIEKFFNQNYGLITGGINYPVTFTEIGTWIDNFLKNRFQDFGRYQDSMVENELILHHSVISPMLNVGLISPREMLDKALEFTKDCEIPLNSLEGFIRQILGWREFIRGVYEVKGGAQRTTNFWKFTRKIPLSFWDGTTGINPVDTVIKKVLKTGYSHHIERLMVLGNFMFLCEFDPDEVYRWFMEMFIDAYDWVMVPNVYGMSQFADGGLMATKPYISGSNYLMKMSNFKKDTWQDIWDALFWRFISKHCDFFLKNPRLSMLVKNFDRMSLNKQNKLINRANYFLAHL